MLVFDAVSFGSQQRVYAQTTTIIQIGNFWFCDPSFEGRTCETTIDVGDTIEWRWPGVRSDTSHTTTECSGDLDACPEPHLWDSGTRTGGTFSYTFGTPGSFFYRCQVHPTLMQGRITVLAGEQPTPTPTTTPMPAPSPVPSPSPLPTPTPVVLEDAQEPKTLPIMGGPPRASGSGSIRWLALGALVIGAGGLYAVRMRRG